MKGDKTDHGVFSVLQPRLVLSVASLRCYRYYDILDELFLMFNDVSMIF